MSAADDAGALAELVPDLWAEPELPPVDPSEEPDGTTSDATVPDLLVPRADDGPGAEMDDLVSTDPAHPDSQDDGDDGCGPVLW